MRRTETEIDRKNDDGTPKLSSFFSKLWFECFHDYIIENN